MTADHDRIRVAAKAASAKFAADYSIVVMPKPLILTLNRELVENGMDLAVLDDGEDGGMVVLIVALRSSAMLVALLKLKRSFIAAMVLFLFNAAWVVACRAFAFSDYLTAFFVLLMGVSAAVALTTHHQLARKRRAYERLRKAGH